MEKTILTSKTVWVNIIAFIAMLVQSKTGFVIDADSQIAILAVINLLLRMVTKSAITWKKDDTKIITGLLVIMLFAGYGCTAANLEKNTYATLSVSQVTYDTALSTIGDLYKQGKIPEQTKAEIIEKAKKYKQAHNTAVAAFLAYKESGLVADQENYLDTLSKASTLLAEFLDLAKPYIEPEGGK